MKIDKEYAVKKRIEEIKNKTWDNEVAHCMEDELYGEFIEWIDKMDDKSFVNNLASVKKIARELMKVRKIKFDRWYA